MDTSILHLGPQVQSYGLFYARKVLIKVYYCKHLVLKEVATILDSDSK